MPHLDALPIHYIGAGGQHALKTLLALARSAEASHVVLIEEPENHLSPASLNGLVRKIQTRCEGKQVILTTHSSYVLNKLGLDHLVLLHGQASMRLVDLPADTLDYFKKLSGYDTLRVVLAKRVILVEGPSDELIVQRAYRDAHGCLPIEDGVDVINVRGLSFARFLDIAKPLGKRVGVLTDNDGREAAEVIARYDAYTDAEGITIHVGELADGTTLEPQIVAACGRAALNKVLGTNYEDDESLRTHMTGNKTSWALKVLEADDAVVMPGYIRDAVA